MTSALPTFPVVLAALLACTCSTVKPIESSPDGGPGSSAAGVGGGCQQQGQCRSGLFCTAGTAGIKVCAPTANVILDGACTLSGECNHGYYCTQEGKCAAAGQGAAGAVCSSEGDCTAGSVCVLTGLTGACAPAGAGDLGQGCGQTTECLAGLLCIGGVCSKTSLSPWAGAICSTTEDSIPRVYFHVPRAGEPGGNTDFYRLPFPNDIRLKNGKVNLSGHPRPGPRVLPVDIVDRTISAIEAQSTGFGANQAIYVRFSKNFNASNFASKNPVDILDITPTSPTYGSSTGFSYGAVLGRTTYICGPFMWVRPSFANPLRPGTTYAMIVRKGIVDMLGSPFLADDDFVAMLGTAAPADPDLAAAYAAYQPLRAYIAAGKLMASEVVGAAVFTTERYEDALAAIDSAVATASAPRVDGWVRCGDAGAVSPCDDGKTGPDHVRGCLAADSSSPNFDAYQGTITLPVFQKGAAPYLTPGDGGNIEYDGSGSAVIQRSDKVCFTLTVPKGTPPATGWPLVVYGHGTGGSYRSVVDLGLADDFAQGAAPAGGAVDGGSSLVATVPMAMLGFDGVLHGTRNGGSGKPVGELVYNFLNPVAARDNTLQAAADLLAIPQALSGFAAQGVLLDNTRLSLYGHSQGGQGAALVAGRQSRYGAIVMSGTGGTLIFTLLGKTQPINLPAVLPYLIGETSAGAVDANHPVLNLMQMYFERSDAVNFARRLFLEPLDTMTAHHILHVYGTKDSYAVVQTQRDYALAAGLQVAPPVLDEFGLKIDTDPLPVTNNEYFGHYGKLTAVEVQYQPTAAYDGHFVSTQNPSARKAIQEMLVTFARDGIPAVSP